jgi:hypothetical protein
MRFLHDIPIHRRGLHKDAGAKNEQRRTSYSRNATSGACSELRKNRGMLLPSHSVDLELPNESVIHRNITDYIQYRSGGCRRFSQRQTARNICIAENT